MVPKVSHQNPVWGGVQGSLDDNDYTNREGGCGVTTKMIIVTTPTATQHNTT